jgi:hypothetical protein
MVNTNENGALFCPHCGGEYLHLKPATDYYRCRARGTSRAVGITIWCEDCSARPRLMLLQRREGDVRLNWRGVPAEETPTERAAA